MSQEQFENWFAFADENKDGELSAEEVNSKVLLHSDHKLVRFFVC